MPSRPGYERFQAKKIAFALVVFLLEAGIGPGSGRIAKRARASQCESA